MNLYANQSAYTAVSETNSSYLYKTKDVPTYQDPISGSTVGLMMIVSSFQYQAPYMSPAYANAANKAGEAAFIECGGKALQDKMTKEATSIATKQGSQITKSIGVTNLEMVTVAGIYKTVKTKQIEFNGPTLMSAKTHLTFGEKKGTVGVRYEW